MLSRKSNRISIILACFVLGFMMAIQFHSTQNSFKYSTQYQRTEELSQRLLATEKERDALKKQTEKMSQDKNAGLIDAQLIEAGATEVTGPGIVVTVEDSSKKTAANENANLYIIHDEDMLRIVNELRAAGAEAISINGQRVVATTEIRCAGPTVSVNNERSAPPFVIQAIGEADTMENAMKMRGGVMDTLSVWGIKVNIDKKTQMTLPSYNRGSDFKYAKSVEKGDTQ
ncbi:DUF881 domain-containing protein [Pectinatus cerevisiiphilus]|uniref:Uncharacterized protein YlxW (UPF0749 family) n=1 Tax=Pectinatus cerevisiiphilus TaxID=86956 RepID=A0A4R3KCB8_9FIRM|nr:DUF881 domain-containing protein [Pectinatus cerevisiiphilus]TCS80866.1 uncharacterized protein YlxW (UPF0749 family) [Pectinatus cerevisiiphilus]